MKPSPEPERVTPSTAVLVVDMLNDFCTDGGVMCVPDATKLYEPIDTLTAHARRAGALVVWACDSHLPGDREFDTRPPHCLEGSWGAQIVSSLQREEVDRYVAKRRFSAFFATDLDLLLREAGVQRTIITGVMTNMCVRATVHDAFFHGYQVSVPSDCVATFSTREHESTLYDIQSYLGKVTSTHEILDTSTP